MWRDEVADVRKKLRGAAILLSVAAAACASRNPESGAGLRLRPCRELRRPEDLGLARRPGAEDAPGNAIVDSQFIHRSVRQDVGEVLSRKGFDETESGQADIDLAYQMDNAGVLSQDTFEKTKKTDFLLSSWVHLEYSGTQYSKRSALVLDIRDREKKLVWRGARTAAEGTSPKEIARGIQQTVGLLLANFPPRPRGSSGGAKARPTLNPAYPRIGKGGPD